MKPWYNSAVTNHTVEVLKLSGTCKSRKKTLEEISHRWSRKGAQKVRWVWPTFMRERLRESLQLLNRASHSVTDLLSRAMPFIWGVEKDTGNKDRSFSTKAMHIILRENLNWFWETTRNLHTYQSEKPSCCNLHISITIGSIWDDFFLF